MFDIVENDKIEIATRSTMKTANIEIKDVRIVGRDINSSPFANATGNWFDQSSMMNAGFGRTGYRLTNRAIFEKVNRSC